MSFKLLLTVPVILFHFSHVGANLEGPFLFWGPHNLAAYKRPALMSLGQDPLLEIYDNQAAIVVFNNQDSAPLSGENFPRLRKLLESKTTLILPQDFLDVHPEYVNNETQVFTLQGPSSERDAEITETFNRLEDIYGKGRVLGILGSSASQDYVNDYPVPSSEDSTTARRDRRQIKDAEKDPADDGEKQQIYNAIGKALLYTSTYPILRIGGDGNNTLEEEYPLKNAVTVTCDEREMLSKLVVTYAMDQGKVILKFKFPSTNTGYWSLGEVEVRDSKGREALLTLKKKNKLSSDYRGARKGFSYRCSNPLEFTDGSMTLLFTDIQHDPKYFPDPEKFWPERFSPDAEAERQSFIYMPFGAGPRACIGERFAYIQYMMEVISLLRNYKVEINEKTVPKITFAAATFVLCPADRIYLTMTKRK